MIVGRDLVEFDRRDIPIYQERGSLWSEAGLDPVSYGAPLDRLFGAPEASHVASLAPGQEVAIPIAEDPFVELGTLSDALALPDGPAGLLDTSFGDGTRLTVPLHDGCSADTSGVDWSTDFQG